MTLPRDEYDIDVTPTASSKAFRMHSSGHLTHYIRNGHFKQLWKRHGDDRDEYHGITNPGYAVVIVADHDEEELVVVTQMHQHIDYHDDNRFTQANQIDYP